jgi:Lysylphosphatidylglycerol synthase TM region
MAKPHTDPAERKPSRYGKLKLLFAIFTLLGVALFGFFLARIGVDEILENIAKFSLLSFGLVLLIYFGRIVVRALAWKYSIAKPYHLKFLDTLRAVLIGESLSSLFPLGILVSGTAKAISVSNRVPLVAGFSSVATENLFYSLSTALLILLGSVAFLFTFDLPTAWVWTLYIFIVVLFVILMLGIMMVIRQWHWASAIVNRLFIWGFAQDTLREFRFKVREFEDLIYGFYRQYPNRFIPIFLLEVVFHLLGVLEAWYVLHKLSDLAPSIYASFLLETLNRTITVFFKFVPFVIGFDEAGAHFVTETLGLGIGLGFTLAIIRKGRLLFWSAVGLLFLIQRELSISDIIKGREE